MRIVTPTRRKSEWTAEQRVELNRIARLDDKPSIQALADARQVHYDYIAQRVRQEQRVMGIFKPSQVRKLTDSEIAFVRRNRGVVNMEEIARALDMKRRYLTACLCRQGVHLDRLRTGKTKQGDWRPARVNGHSEIIRNELYAGRVYDYRPHRDVLPIRLGAPLQPVSYTGNAAEMCALT